jgi:hypothetical protein
MDNVKIELWHFEVQYNNYMYTYIYIYIIYNQISNDKKLRLIFKADKK